MAVDAIGVGMTTALSGGYNLPGRQALLGPYSSGLALSAAKVAQRHACGLWNHGGASEAIYRRGFARVVGILSPSST